MSKQNLIEAYFLLGGVLSAREALTLFGTMNLVQTYIPRMRLKDYVFHHEECDGIDNNGNDVKYFEYWLDRDVKQPKPMKIQFYPSGRPIFEEEVIHV